MMAVSCLSKNTSISHRVLPWAVGFGLFGIALAMASKVTVVDFDLFHEMALFREILSLGQMPLKDPFAYTPTIEPVVHHEWGVGAVVYLLTVTSGLGAPGLMMLKYGLSFAVCLGCFVNARRRGASMSVFAFLAPIALVIGWMAFSTVRAQLFTLLFLVIQLFFFEEDRKGRRWWIWVWLPLLVIWANLHGGVAAGLGMLGIYCLDRFGQAWREHGTITETFRKTRHLVFVGICSVLALYVSPYGSDYLPYLLRAIRMERPLVYEWQPIWKVGHWTTVLLFGCSILVGIYGVWRRGLRPVFEPLALLSAAWLAGLHIRHLSIYAVVWVCLLPGMMQTTGLGEAIGKLWRNLPVQLVLLWSACGVCGLGYSIQNQFWRLQIPTDPAHAPAGAPIYPVGAVDYLQSNGFRGNLMVPFDVGAFVSWNLYPNVKVSNDSRYEVAYPHGLVEEIVAFYRAETGWHATLHRYPTDAILVPRGSPLEKQLDGGGPDNTCQRWLCVYRDCGYLLYVPESQLAG
jgi:hypothetical protein